MAIQILESSSLFITVRKICPNKEMEIAGIFLCPVDLKTLKSVLIVLNRGLCKNLIWVSQRNATFRLEPKACRSFIISDTRNTRH